MWGDIYNASCFLELEGDQFGRDIIASVKPRILGAWTWEFARDRLSYDGGLETSSELLWKLPLLLAIIQQDEHRSNTDRSLDATKVFNLSLGAKVTDEKDRVYGVPGFASISSLVEIKSDYHLSLRQVYVDLSKNLLVRGSNCRN